MSANESLGIWDSQGRVIGEAANALPFNHLHILIRKVLRAEERSSTGDVQTMPHLTLQQVYGVLGSYQRQVFEDVVLDHLGDMVRNYRTQWAGRPAHQLLLLAGVVFAESRKREDAIAILWEMAQPERLRSRAVPNLHWRSLQTLVQLGHGGHPNFWMEQYRVGGDQYAHVVLAGLSLCGPWIAMEWVAHEIESEQVVSALFRRLPWFVQKHGAWEMERILWQYNIYSNIHEHHRAELRQLGRRFGLDIGRPESEVFSHWTQAEMERFAAVMHIELEATPRDEVGWRQALETQFRSSAAGARPLDDPTPDVEVILGMAETVSDRKIEVPEPFRSRIRDHGDRLVSRLVSLDDGWRLSEATGILCYSRRDAQGELRERLAGR